MQGLLSLILLNVASQYLPAKIHSISADYLRGATTIALMTNNPNNWNVQFNTTLTVRRLDDTTPHNQPKADFIVDLRYQPLSANHLKPLTRGASTRFVLITSKETQKPTSEALLQIRLCHVLLVTIESNDVNITYPYDPCRGIGTDATHGRNCNANISFLNFQPCVIFADGVLEGSEGNLAKAIAKSMDIELNYVNRESFWGHFEDSTGLEGDISTGRSLLAIGALYWYYWRLQFSDIVIGCTSMDATFMVPSAAGPVRPTWFIILVSELTPVVWLCVFLSYVLVTTSSFIIERNPKYVDYWPFHNLALLLGSPQKHIQRRSLTISVIFYGFLLTTYYQTIMSSKLTAPNEVPEITTLKEVAESGLDLVGPWNANNVVYLTAGATNNSVIHKINRTLRNDDTPLRDTLVDIAINRKKAIFRHGAILYYESQRDPRSADRVHLVEEALVSYKPIIMIRKHECLFRQILMRYHRLCDCGLIQKWESDVMSKKRLFPDKGPKKLTFEHIKGFFILLGIGWSASLLAFAGEMCISRFSRRRKVFNHLRKNLARIE